MRRFGLFVLLNLEVPAMTHEPPKLSNVSIIHSTANSLIADNALKTGWKLHGTFTTDDGLHQTLHYVLKWDGNTPPQPIIEYTLVRETEREALGV